MQDPEDVKVAEFNYRLDPCNETAAVLFEIEFERLAQFVEKDE